MTKCKKTFVSFVVKNIYMLFRNTENDPCKMIILVKLSGILL
jgi:hypothetical protein